jgi:hypothetical protein
VYKSVCIMLTKLELLTTGSLLPNNERKEKALQAVAAVGSLCLEHKLSGEKKKENRRAECI